MSLKPRLHNRVSGRIIAGSFELVRSEEVSETLSGVPLDMCYKCRRVSQVNDKIGSQSLTNLDSINRSPT